MKKLFFCFLMLFFGYFLPANDIGMLEFISQPIEEILVILGDEAGLNLLADETVSGKTSFFFPGGEAETALELFLEKNHLYKNIRNGFIEISKVKVEVNENKIVIEAYMVRMADILHKIASVTKNTILFDPLPDNLLTIYLEKQNLQEILNILIESIPDYQLNVENDAFFIKNMVANVTQSPFQNDSSASSFSGKISQKQGLYSINIQSDPLIEILKTIFLLEEKEFIYLSKQQFMIGNFRLKDKNFTELLDLLMEQAGMRYIKEKDDLYYILEVDRETLLMKYKTQIRIPLKHRSVQDIAELIPRELSSWSSMFLDLKSNSIILYGKIEQVQPLRDYINLLDEPNADWVYKRYSLNYLSLEDIRKILPDNLRTVLMEMITDTKLMLVYLHKDLEEDFESFLLQVDSKPASFPVNFKYIKTSTFMQSIPPGFTSSEFMLTGNNSLIFFKGSLNKYQDLMKILPNIDIPKPQLRYDVLVVQYQENKRFNWDINFSNSILNAGNQTAFLGNLGSVASLNFDITSAFGYAFSLNLNSDISQARARVLVDTTLNALTNESASLQNTNTYRYRDTVKNPDTGNEEVTGVSREIQSGLFIEINGWVSGDNMITMDVSTTISRQEGVNENNALGALPPTSEKIVNTHVRTRSGEPVIIGGLIQLEKGESIQKVPFLGSIPILGLLFQKRIETVENQEMVIYIVPHVEFDEKLITEESEVRRLYEKYRTYLP